MFSSVFFAKPRTVVTGGIFVINNNDHFPEDLVLAEERTSKKDRQRIMEGKLETLNKFYPRS